MSALPAANAKSNDVVNDLGRVAGASGCHRERRHDERRVLAAGGVPADGTVEQVPGPSEVELDLAGRELGDVCDPKRLVVRRPAVVISARSTRAGYPTNWR